VPDDLEKSVDRFAINVAIRFGDDFWTYAELDAYANRVAHWALAQGLAAGDCVALFMENRTEYVPIWYGLTKVGVVTALVNHNLHGEALAHCIDICQARHVIYGAKQDEAIDSVEGRLDGKPRPVDARRRHGRGSRSDLRAALRAQSSERPARRHREHLRGKDLALYVYTSGTTGLPKAARLTHMRVQGMMRTFIAPCRFGPKDRIYITLPLYHGTGGLCGVGGALNTGASIILREKFSASHFWEDAVKYQATAFTYIGELCRYLVNSPPHPQERRHRIRTGLGNGLRPEIWEQFLKRFRIPHLAEFYGSTEGNVSFVNFDGKVGAVGKIPGIVADRFSHVRFVKFDVESEMPVRDESGFCIECADDEVGEAIGRLGEGLRGRFEGYNDPEATKKKILHDVFRKGDMWFRTGDLMRKDAHGYVYFVDRIGDTFRWKGENVSTNEVAEVMSQFKGIETANVYGVPVPGMDGKAGMAAITGDDDLDMAALGEHLRDELPAYAVPLFIRRQAEAETTGTFKYRKVELVKDGFDPGVVADPLWYADPATGHYAPLSSATYTAICAGELRF
jgi:fatty-acyl-CoA synthase